MVDGFLLVDKPESWTSHDVVAKVRGLLAMRKVGHSGTLDPMATGLLVLGLGKATRLLRFVQDLPKEYEATVRFGVATTTGDADGDVVEEMTVDIGQKALGDALGAFVGTIQQTPPQVSAIKRDGKRLHELARAGVEVELEPRPVEVYELELIDFDSPDARVRVLCGKGTYIRVLADDIAKALGTRAHLTVLRRTSSGSLLASDAITIDQLEASEDREALVLSMADGLCDIEAVSVPPGQLAAVRDGATVDIAVGSPGPVRLLDGGRLLGIYRPEGDKLVPEVVIP